MVASRSNRWHMILPSQENTPLSTRLFLLRRNTKILILIVLCTFIVIHPSKAVNKAWKRTNSPVAGYLLQASPSPRRFYLLKPPSKTALDSYSLRKYTKRYLRRILFSSRKFIKRIAGSKLVGTIFRALRRYVPMAQVSVEWRAGSW